MVSMCRNGSDCPSKAVFTLRLDYDRIVIKFNLEWVHIN